MFWFYCQSTHFASLLWRNNGGVLLRGFGPRQAMRVLVALTVYSGHKVLQGTAVQGESSRSLALLVLLHGLQHHLLLKEGKLPSLQCKSLQLSVACARRPSHAWRHTWLSPRRVQTCNHMCTCARPVTPHITHGHLEQRLTALARLSALDMCSKSTKGWVKNSAKMIRESGFLSSSRSRRSLQSLETRAPGGS